MAVVKSPKNKKHKQDWVQSIKRQNKPVNFLSTKKVLKKKLYTNSELTPYFRINWKLNNWTLWNL